MALLAILQKGYAFFSFDMIVSAEIKFSEQNHLPAANTHLRVCNKIMVVYG
jgi:hypothetical protein